MEVKEEDDASSLSAGEGEAVTPPVEERYVRVGLTPRTSGKLPLPSHPPQHATTAPSCSSNGSSCLPPAQRPKPVAPSRKRKAESEGERPVQPRKEVKIRVMNLEVQEKLGEMKGTAEQGNHEQKLKDMAFVRMALIELGGQHRDEIVRRKV